ncbi:biotin synthase BioB [Parvibium lacunae]|uniref:Biotin synthase n=1 Tax=Parvibium lacunae TaxID=1888893 RepID=A0A368L6R1_9BURK|nr:biotin synthase BioB [Parvibium lacunae]RCS59316.1 biotin synthase BioB [Parvibium lacunae]
MNAVTPIQFHKPQTAPTKVARWSREQILELFSLPFADLMFRAQQVHREHFNANEVQRSTLLSIKTGGCEENCGYCPQSAHFDTEVEATKVMALDEVVDAAKQAKAAGASRFCMGAAWRGPNDRDLEKVLPMIRAVRDLGMQTCGTFGLLKEGQAEQLKEAGLDYYNHNIDTAPEYYGEVISTRNFSDRIDTLNKVREAGLNVCCGGIVGMGESRDQRAGLLEELANMPTPPESVPINYLVQVEGTPLAGTDRLDPFEFIRTIAAARITMPTSYVRLSAGREAMSDEMQALCFLAGANSIFYGDRLLTTSNPEADKDATLFSKLGIRSV